MENRRREKEMHTMWRREMNIVEWRGLKREEKEGDDELVKKEKETEII